MESFMQECYLTASYARLSKDDGDKAESDSINNQKELIRNFAKSHPDIQIVEEYSDDGFSGVNFDRPDFKRMIEDIKAKKIKCVIVKDLSRFGRNYIETGKYIEEIFPFMGVRFIAINDDYDSTRKKTQSDNLVLPFKNLINDIYCKDISTKVRSNLNAKRKKGDYVGSFAPYGYKKSEENKNQLIVDEPAARIVKKMFDLKLVGKSNQGIADVLNNEKVPTPYEYRIQTEQGKNFNTSFEIHSNPQWSVNAVLRILTNEVYLGHMVQGKSVRPNYKVKQPVKLDSNEWICVKNTHDAIVSQNNFDLVQKLLLMDTRTPPGQDTLYMFSGLVHCPNCGEHLIRKSISLKKAKYVYYGCYTKDRRIKCKGISIREDTLEQVVLEAIQRHIELIVEMDELFSYVDKIPLQQQEIRDLDGRINELKKEITKYQKLKKSLHEDYQAGIINQEEYIDLKNIYNLEGKDLEPLIQDLKKKREEVLAGKSDNQECIDLFKEFRNITELNRYTLVMLISRIEVFSKEKIHICFAYQDEFDKMNRHIQQLKVRG